jgi:hypothetical protein
MNRGMRAGTESPGSFAAVGTMDPEIEIWDLDTLDVLEPSLVLGGAAGDARRDPHAASSKKTKLKKGSHRSSVLSLAWNPTVRNVLASGSADKCVKVQSPHQCPHQCPPCTTSGVFCIICPCMHYAHACTQRLQPPAAVHATDAWILHAGPACTLRLLALCACVCNNSPSHVDPARGNCMHACALMGAWCSCGTWPQAHAS